MVVHEVDRLEDRRRHGCQVRPEVVLDLQFGVEAEMCIRVRIRLRSKFRTEWSGVGLTEVPL